MEVVGRPKRVIQTTNWCFTFFGKDGVTIEEFQDNLYELTTLRDTGLTSVAYGVETCPDTQRLHLQGYMQLRSKGMRKKNSRAADLSIT